MNNQTNKKRNITLAISGVVTLLLITIGLSFAYFTANITGQETGTTITVGAGTMNIAYSNNSGVITVSDKKHGNGKAGVPVGLLTADEISFAGGVLSQGHRSQKNYYLYIMYWLISKYITKL